jgi:PilZ domain
MEGMDGGAMDMISIAQENSGSEVRPDAGPDARRSGRSHTNMAAQIAFCGSVLDCVLLDVSPRGARVFLRGALADVPDLVTLRLPGGESRFMRCRWQIGPQVGLEAVGDAVPPS